MNELSILLPCDSSLGLEELADFTDNLAMHLMANPTDRIPYKVTTKLDVGTFMPAIRVKEEGEFTFAPPR